MGDRSNIIVRTGANPSSDVYLYGHWMGDSALTHLAHGLRSGRVGDPAYLTRIIFSSMIKDSVDAETGFGISTEVQDNEYPLVFVDGTSGHVSLMESDSTREITGPEFLSWFDEQGDSATIDGLRVFLGGEPDED